jgi:hypothetical protein
LVPHFKAQIITPAVVEGCSCQFGPQFFILSPHFDKCPLGSKPTHRPLFYVSTFIKYRVDRIISYILYSWLGPPKTMVAKVFFSILWFSHIGDYPNEKISQIWLLLKEENRIILSTYGNFRIFSLEIWWIWQNVFHKILLCMSHTRLKKQIGHEMAKFWEKKIHSILFHK